MSERQLSRSYGSAKKWEFSDGHTATLIRWKFAKSKEKWLEENELTEKWLFKNLEWMIVEGKIVSVRKSDEVRLYYIVTMENGAEYYLIFELTKNLNNLVLIFEDHWQNYRWNRVLKNLEFDFEEYDCYQNGIEDILFSHRQFYVWTTIVGGKMDFNFSTNTNLPLWKLLNDYHSLFEEMTKYNSDSIDILDKRRQIENVVKIANMFRKLKSDAVTRFQVKFYNNQEWLDYDSGVISMKVRICDDGNFAILHKDGSTEILPKYCSYDIGYKIKDGVIVDWEDKKVTNQELAKTIISDIREAKKLFYRMKQEFLAD